MHTGDRGLNLSGGQKQRVSIARALYAQADVVVLDDPLSALDARVGRRVFEDGIKGLLGSRGATVVLSTNQLQFVRHADVVVFISGGVVEEEGAPAQLLAAGGGFASMMAEAAVGEELGEIEDDDVDGGEEGEVEREGAGGSKSQVEEGVREANGDGPTSAAAAAAAAGAPAVSSLGQGAGAQAKGRLTTEERVAEGHVGWQVVGAYVRAMGGSWAAVYLLASFLAVEVLRLAASVWLSIWTGDTEAEGGSSEHSAVHYLAVYAALSGVQCAVTFVNALGVAWLGLVRAPCYVLASAALVA